MKKAIYKIENMINHKVYIGQSARPVRRWREHIGSRCAWTSLIHRALEKYGAENFSFEIIGWFDDYHDKEKYYIQYYRSLAPYGYNILRGGDEPPHYSGEDNPASKITKETANRVIQQLMDLRIPRKTIIANNHITADIVHHINDGDAWRRDDLTYPLRPSESVLDKYRVKYVQWMCCASTIPLNDLGARVGWGRSSAKMINCGANHHNELLRYPLRNNAEYNKQVLSQDSCIDYLHFGE